MPTIRLVPSTYSVSNNSLTVNNIDNAYTNTDSTSYATCTTTSTNTRYIYLRGFDFNSIPSGAEVTGFSVKFKANEINLSTNTNYRPRLVNNTTTINGTSSTVGTSVQTQTFTGVSETWDTIRGYSSDFGIRFTVRLSSNNQTGTLNIYGAEIEVTYTIPTTYQIVATSNVVGVVASPSIQTVYEGEDAVISFNTSSIAGYTVLDNDIDVTNNLVLVPGNYSGSTSQTAQSLETGASLSTISFYTSSNSQRHNFNYAVGHTAESPGSTSTGSGSWTYVKANGESTNGTGWADFIFDFSEIPVGATINNVQVRCYGAVEDRSQSYSHSDISLYSNGTQKGTTQSFTSSTNSIITISNPGTWTREELQSATLRFAVGYYGGHLFGITWTVTYSVVGDDHYTYTINNVQTAHTVVLNGAYVPPEEEPDKVYYPITISSINATTDPGNGTTRVESGSSETITIYPSDPQLTLAIDNGVDITSQLSGGIPSNNYTITTQVNGASYGFNLNNNTGYYVSTNAGVSSSAAVARINFDFETSCLVTIQYINYAEATYDFGIFGKIDTTLSTATGTDSTNNCQLICNTSTYNTSSPQTITYEIPSGQHYVDIKYKKDSYTDSHNDTLQWKILSIESTGSGGEYTYTLSAINQSHNIIFVFGDVDFWYVTSNGVNCRLYPNGQYVLLDNDNYTLVIVPDEFDATVSISDNNVDVTNQLTTHEGVDKNNNPVINYIYNISHVSTGHTISVSCTNGGGMSLLVKIDDRWTTTRSVYRKENNIWVEKTNINEIFDTNIKYINKG